MINATRTATFLGGLFLLAACGSKGPLVLPPQPGSQPQTAAQPAAAVDDNTAREAPR